MTGTNLRLSLAVIIHEKKRIVMECAKITYFFVKYHDSLDNTDDRSLEYGATFRPINMRTRIL
jgi:hypothetical protein